MTAARSDLTGPADMCRYQNDLVRTGKYISIGRIKKIAIGPSADFDPRTRSLDPFMLKYGRYIDFRERSLPLALSLDHSLALVPSTWLWQDGSIATLPDVPDPLWVPPKWSEEEISGSVERPKEKDAPQMLPQRLADRADGYLDAKPPNDHVLVFQPVLTVVFQPEVNEKFESTGVQATFWWLDCQKPDSQGKHMCLLVDEKTGETHFLNGEFEICRVGEFRQAAAG